ncbi:arrestin domain-containing protein 3-like [Aulostomus maculatus]
MTSNRLLTITCDALNESGTFSEGDTVTGAVTLVLSKQTLIKRLFVKLKGDARVRWLRKSSSRTYTSSAHRRYFKLRQFLIPEYTEGTVVPQGIHVYSFCLNLPQMSMPSTFSGSHGKIVYKLAAKLSRSWRLDHTVEKEIDFVSKSYQNPHSLMSRQVGSTEKQVVYFSKGNVHVEASIDKTAYIPGEVISIVAKINNASSSHSRPKFSFVQDVEYRAKGHSSNKITVIEKVTNRSLDPQTQKEVWREIKLPSNLSPTIHNCEIILVEYHVKVYLDVSDSPQARFPVVIIPPDLAHGAQHGAPGATESLRNSEFSPAVEPVSSGPTYPLEYSDIQQYSENPDHHLMNAGLPASPTYIISPTAPMADLPSAAVTGSNFLSQTDEIPPARSLLLLTPASGNPHVE